MHYPSTWSDQADPMLLNRCVILITPKAPYIKWANSLDEDGPRYKDCFDDDGPPVFLGPDCVTMKEMQAFVRKNWDLFFDEMLELWCTDPALWPSERNYATFKAWFDVEIRSMVFDTVDHPLLLE